MNYKEKILYMHSFFLLTAFVTIYYFSCAYIYNNMLFENGYYFIEQVFGNIDQSIDSFLFNIKDGSHLHWLDSTGIIRQDLYLDLMNAFFMDGESFLLSILLCYLNTENILSLYTIYTNLMYNFFIGMMLSDNVLSLSIFANLIDELDLVLHNCPEDIEHIHINNPLAELTIINYIDEITVDNG